MLSIFRLFASDKDYTKLEYKESEDLKEIKLRLSYKLPISKKILFALEDNWSEFYRLYLKLYTDKPNEAPIYIYYKINKPFPYCDLNKQAKFLNLAKYVGTGYFELCKDGVHIHTREAFFNRENKWHQGTNAKIIQNFSGEYFLELKTVNINDDKLQPKKGTNIKIKLPSPNKRKLQKESLPFVIVITSPIIYIFYKKSKMNTTEKQEIEDTIHDNQQ